MSKMLILCLSVVAVLMQGCSQAPFLINPKKTNAEPSKFIGIFIDGTSNDETSATNVSRLRNLAYLQGNPSVHTIYIRGIGTEAGPITNKVRQAFGFGLPNDVKQAYTYLGNTYDGENGDKILIFGFSRGAYTARVLNELIDIAGIPDFSSIDQGDFTPEEKFKLKNKIINSVYSAYLKGATRDERVKNIESVNGFKSSRSMIEFIGLWDTVAAIGVPKYNHDLSPPEFRKPKKHYDQLCNVKKAAHVMSIDDNRARVFVPLTLTYDDIVEDCSDRKIDNIVDEVWFSGSHSDVGGGSQISDLGGVSLNWMIKKIDESVPGFLPKNSGVIADPLGDSTVAQKGKIHVYGNRNRHFLAYARQNSYNGGIPKVHATVFERISQKPRKYREFAWGHPLNNDPDHKNGPDSKCIRVETEDRYKNKKSPGKLYFKLDQQKCYSVVH